MVRTRQGTAVPARGSVSDNSTPKEPKPAKKRGASDREPQQQGRAKKRKSSPGPSQDASGPSETREAEEQQHLPRYTTPDLEYDWDRSKLKDPRPTPGRERRPRYDKYDIPAELAARCPPSPEKPKGRLNAIQKDKLFDEKTRRDPAESFHDLYKCRDKGPNGSPTYDHAGFRLDYEKVMNWFKPVRYNKSRMINGMDRAVARGQSLNEHIMQAFFEEDLATVKEVTKENTFILDLVKDTISKDLGIPVHKIDHAEIDMWEEKDYQKHKVEDWLTYSDEDKKRSMKMLRGGSLRV